MDSTVLLEVFDEIDEIIDDFKDANPCKDGDMGLAICGFDRTIKKDQDNWFLVTRIPRNMLFGYSSTVLHNYIQFYRGCRILFNGASVHRFRINYDIVQIVHVDGEYIPIIKTTYIRQIQRAWKKKFNYKMEQIHKNKTVQSILHRQIHGHFLHKIPVYNLVGLLQK